MSVQCIIAINIHNLCLFHTFRQATIIYQACYQCIITCYIYTYMGILQSTTAYYIGPCQCCGAMQRGVLVYTCYCCSVAPHSIVFPSWCHWMRSSLHSHMLIHVSWTIQIASTYILYSSCILDHLNCLHIPISYLGQSTTFILYFASWASNNVSYYQLDWICTV